MSVRLRVLIVEDSPYDVALVVRALRRGGYEPSYERVDTPEGMRSALDVGSWDLVIADYSMPRFSGLAALELLEEKGLDLPFILVSGSIGEDVAVAGMKAGAHDYLMKGNLIRLVPAVERELREAEVRRERRRAEEAQRRSEEQYRLLAENATDLIARYDADRVFRYASPASRTVLGYSPDELVGHSGYEFVHPDDRDAVARTHAEALESERMVTMQYRGRRKDGSYLWIETTARAVRNPSTSRVEEVISVTRDITERKRAEEDLARARDEALEAVRLKSAFLANMSHEIRTPLNIILGYNSLLVEHFAASGDDDLLSMVDSVDQAAKRLIDTVQSILDLSKIETGSFEVMPQALSIQATIEREITSTRARAERKGLSLSWQVDEPEATVLFDEHCLSRALTNILDNAVKFTERGGVSVKLSRDQDRCLVFEVRDTGVGIDEAYAPRLFEPFSQEDFGSTRRFEGSGLGLVLAKRYLELNGARVSVESEKGQGSIFRIHFAGHSEVEGA